MKRVLLLTLIILLLLGCVNPHRKNEKINYSGTFDNREAITGSDKNVKNKTAQEEKYKDVDKENIITNDDTKGITPENHMSNTVDTYSPYLSDDERRKKYIKNNPRLSQNKKQAIKMGMVMTGMTENDVKASIGKPDKINTTTSGSLSRAQWVYRSEGMYVYFTHGTVDAIQN